MNTFNRCCQVAALALLLALGIEGIQFGHEIMAQARLLQPQTELIAKDSGQPDKSLFVASLERK